MSKMSEGSSKLRLENAHGISHMNFYARGMGTLVWIRLRGGWMGRSQRASTENPSVFTHIFLSTLHVCTHLSDYTSTVTSSGGIFQIT